MWTHKNDVAQELRMRLEKVIADYNKKFGDFLLGTSWYFLAGFNKHICKITKGQIFSSSVAMALCSNSRYNCPTVNVIRGSSEE